MSDLSRSILRIGGEDREHFLQGILTQDVASLREQKIQFAALLSPQGKILHDMFLVEDGDSILIDTPTVYAEQLRKRLTMYKLRAKVTITEEAMEVGYSKVTGLTDPRHSQLPKRNYGSGGDMPVEKYRAECLKLGIPDSAVDFGPDAIVAMDAGYDLLHGISFTKGCYVGQEVTARMHYKHIARKGFYIVEGTERLALLRFDDVKDNHITLDGEDYTVHLPEWMTPKLAQHKANQEQNA